MNNALSIRVIRALLADRNNRKANEICAEAHPVDVAVLLSTLTPDEVWQALRCFDATVGAKIFAYLEVDLQQELSKILTRDEMASLLKEMRPDDRADFLQQLPPEMQEIVVGAMAQTEQEDIRRLCAFKQGTVGAVMTSDYTLLQSELTVEEAISRLRLVAPNKETIYYSYVVDGQRRLVGFVSLKDLILAHPQKRVSDIYHREILFAHVSDDQEDAARRIQKYDLLALPVVDENEALVGIVTHDDAMAILIQEQTEDVEKMMAIGGPHEPGMYLRTSSMEHFRRRVTWIVVLALLGLVSGYIIQAFEGLLLQFSILATFIPMLADTGGNTGSQSSTLVVRALALKEISPADIFKVLFKELKVSAPLGIVLSVLAYARVTIFSDAAACGSGVTCTRLAVAVATALGLQVVTSTLIGALLPIIAVKGKFDPAVVASPALTTVVDITGLFLYFFTLKLILGM